ncbi:MAG: serine protease [Ruminococcaceae bacterium]|nr:serine protease [Oscillospiraceae bacterium]
MKRFISSVLVAVMILCCFPLGIYAQARNLSKQEIYASELKELGLFRGVSETNFDLERAPTRVEALVMLIRVLGKEAEAIENTFEHPFTDVPGWADNYVGYAYTNGLTNGQSETLFGTGDASSNMYITFVLRALGYTDTDGKDFRWDDPFTLAKETGLLTKEVDTGNFLRADVVTISHNALDAYLKGSTVTLSAKLIEAEVFTKEAFDAVYNSHKNSDSTEPLPEGGLSSEQIFDKCSPAVFYIEIYDRDKYQLGTGSGFFIDDKGTAITNYHVMEDAYYAFAQLSDSDEYYEILGIYDYSKENDWAVIKVDCSDNAYLDIGDTSKVLGGTSVYAIGSPLGLKNTISEGLISNPARIVEGTTYFQTDAATSPGSSGGALLDKNGQVIGITSATHIFGQNLNLALPITYITNHSREKLTSLKEHITSYDPAFSDINYILSENSVTVSAGNIEYISFDNISTGMPEDVIFTLTVEDKNIAEVDWADMDDNEFPWDIEITGVSPGTTSFTLSNDFNEQSVTVPITVTDSTTDENAAYNYLKQWVFEHGMDYKDYVYTEHTIEGENEYSYFTFSVLYNKVEDLLFVTTAEGVNKELEIATAMQLTKENGRYYYFVECFDFDEKYEAYGSMTPANFDSDSSLYYEECVCPEYLQETFLELCHSAMYKALTSFDKYLVNDVGGISAEDFGFISLYK